MSTSTYLIEERRRLKLTQAQLATRMGIATKSQHNYESGLRSPDAKYLTAAAALGMDILYVLTGEHNKAIANELALKIQPEEWRFFDAYRNAPPSLREAAMIVLGARGTDKAHPKAITQGGL